MKSKKLLLIFSFMVFVVIVIIAIQMQNSPNNTSLPQFGGNPTAIPQIQTPGGKSPNASSLLSIKKLTSSSVSVTIDTSGKPVTAVQIELSYDPQILTNVSITPGNFFTNPLILSSKVDPANKTIFLALAVSPQQQSPSGQGTIATISFTPNLGISTQTALQFTQRTKVTAEGEELSVLKDSTGITLQL